MDEYLIPARVTGRPMASVREEGDRRMHLPSREEEEEDEEEDDEERRVHVYTFFMSLCKIVYSLC